MMPSRLFRMLVLACGAPYAIYGSRWRTASWILTIPTGHRAWRQGVAPNGKFGATAWSNFG